MSTTLNVTSTDQDRDYSAYRFGQTFTYTNAREMADRDPYGRFIVRELPDEALGSGIDLNLFATEELHPKSVEAWKVLQTPWKKLIKGAEIERTFGYCIYALFQKEEGKGAPYLKVFEPADVDKISFNNDETLKYVKLKERLYDNALMTDEPHEFAGKDIKNVWFNIQRSKRYFWEGRSILEGCWDELQGLRAIRMGAVIIAIRKGAGLRLITLPPDPSPKEIDAMATAGKQLDSFNGYFLVPHGADVQVESGAGTMRYDILKAVLIESMSAYLKVPKARLSGIEPGNLEGATVNERALFDVYRRIQREYKSPTDWLSESYNDYYDWSLAGEYDLSFRVRQQISKEEEARVAEVLSKSLIAYYNSGLMTLEEVRLKMGMPQGDTKVLLELKESREKALDSQEVAKNKKFEEENTNEEEEE